MTETWELALTRPPIQSQLWRRIPHFIGMHALQVIPLMVIVAGVHCAELTVVA